MVRLKSSQTSQQEPSLQFQFHYGSIKIQQHPTLQKSKNECLFQFHYGSIKMLLIECKYLIYKVSIPLWFD